MRAFLISALIGVFAVVVVAARADEEKVPLDKLPAEVVAALGTLATLVFAVLLTGLYPPLI